MASQLPPELPAVVQAVQLPISVADEERINAAATLAACSNFSTPHMGADLKNPKNIDKVLSTAKMCVDAVNTAVRNGTISDAPALTLALRSLPLTSIDGKDNVALTSDDIATKIVANRGGIGFDYHLPGIMEGNLNRQPFTAEEIGDVTIRDGRTSTPDMTPTRSIPIDASTAYIMTAADVVIHPVRYQSSGKTLAESIADARTRHPTGPDANIAELCMTNDPHATLQDCQAAAARNTADLIISGEAKPYDPALYGPERYAATAMSPEHQAYMRLSPQERAKLKIKGQQ